MSNISITNATRANSGLQAENDARAGVPAGNAAAPLLGGKPLTVSSAISDIDKLVARIKQEDEDAKLSSARQRISVAMTVLASLNVKLTEQQVKNFAMIEELNDLIAKLSSDLPKLESELNECDLALAVKTKALESAVENQIQAGKDYRIAKEKADAVKEGDEKARVKAEEALAAATAKLKLANETVKAATSAKNEAVAHQAVLSAKVNGIKSQITTANAQIADCTNAIGTSTLTEVSSALRATAAEVVTAEKTESSEEMRKEEEKKEALDPAKAIHDSLVRITEELENTIESRRENNV